MQLQPRSHRRHRWRWLAVLVGMGALMGIGYFYFQDFQRSSEIDREISRLEQETQALKVRNVELGDLLRYLNSETYAEQRARLELGLVKPGEQVIVVPPKPAAGGSAGAPAQNEPAASTPLQGWWTYFFRNAR